MIPLSVGEKPPLVTSTLGDNCILFEKKCERAYKQIEEKGQKGLLLRPK